MAAPSCTDAEFIELFETVGPVQMAKRFGIAKTNIYKRRRNLEAKYHRPIIAARGQHSSRAAHIVKAPQRIHERVENGIVLVGGDAHYWPGPPSTAHRGLVAFAKKKAPALIVMNGDVVDGARISRHARIGWEEQPELIDEIEICKERMEEIRQAAPKKCKFIWPLGNHDARFETRLANVAPEYARINGVHLKDHFGWWEGCWSLWINEDVVIKHRNKGGVHATHNNTVQGGKTMITNHLHSQKVTPYTDYNGTRWGVDTGCIAAVGGDQFMDYLEDNPVNWRSGFCVLTFVDGVLLQPQLARVMDEDAGLIDYCGEIYDV